jgi:hypothetical protein
MSTPQSVEITIRKEADGTYGIGEVVAPGCALFRAGNYGLTKAQFDQRVTVAPQP